METTVLSTTNTVGCPKASTSNGCVALAIDSATDMPYARHSCSYAWFFSQHLKLRRPSPMLLSQLFRFLQLPFSSRFDLSAFEHFEKGIVFDRLERIFQSILERLIFQFFKRPPNDISQISPPINYSSTLAAPIFINHNSYPPDIQLLSDNLNLIPG